MSRTNSFVGLTLALCAAFAGCGTSTDTPDDTSASDDDEESTPAWYCAANDDATSCSCERNLDGWTVVNSREVPLCQDFPCCLYSPDQETDIGTGYCACLDTDNCAAEASSRPGATMVALCPPDATIPPVQCAEQGENCSTEYLQGANLEGCCTGGVCRENSDGIPVCQPATDEEVAFSEQCSKFARGTASHALTLVTPTLTTSVGVLTLPPVMYAFLTVGPLGCVSSIDLTLRPETGLNCNLALSASVAGSEITLTSVSGDFSSCPGYTGGTAAADGVFVLTEPAGTLMFNGVACDPQLDHVAGQLDFHLVGGESNGITLADQNLRVEGGIRASSVTGECAAAD